MALKNGRPKPKKYTPEQSREKRAKQAARALLSEKFKTFHDGYHANWNRIERHLRDLPHKRYDFMGLEIPGGAITRCWPDPPKEEAAS